MATATKKKAPAKKKAAPKKAAAPAAPTGPTDDQIIADIRKNFGFESWMLDADPALRGVLLQGTREHWDAARVQGALQATTWWKQHSDSQRSWAELQANDPATAAQKRNTEQAAVQAAATAAGVTLSADRLASIVNSALSESWSAPQLQSAIASEFHYDPQHLSGSAASTKEQFAGIANAYLLPMGDDAMGGYVQQALAGTLDQAGFTELMKNQAKNMYGLNNPTIGTALDAGTTMAQIADPYRQRAAKELEIPPDQIDMTQTKWQKALMQPDAKTGVMRPMTDTEWTTALHQRDSGYDWEHTRGSREAATELANGFVKAIRGGL